MRAYPVLVSEFLTKRLGASLPMETKVAKKLAGERNAQQ